MNLQLLGQSLAQNRCSINIKIFEEMKAENLPNLEKETVNPYPGNTKLHTGLTQREPNPPRHIAIKMPKIKE